MKIFAAIGMFFVAVLILAMVSLIPTWLWFTFDDTLAHVLNNPRLVGLPFWEVWAFTLFLSCVFKASQTNNCKKD